MSSNCGTLWGALLAIVALWLPVYSATGSAAPNPTLMAIPDNTALDLGAFSPEKPVGSVYNAREVTDYSGFAYEPAGHQMLLFGGGHSTTHTDTVYSFNFSALAWVSLYTPVPASHYDVANFNATYCAWQNRNNPSMTPLARHTYDTLVVPGMRGKLLMFSRGTSVSAEVTMEDLGGQAYPSSLYIPEYDTATRTWRWIDPGSNCPPTGSGAGGCEYDPMSDKVIVVSQAGLWTYDVQTETSSKVVSFSIPGLNYACDLVYFPPNQKMYYMAWGTPGRVYEVTLDRANWSNSTVVEVTGMSGTPSWNETGWAYDSVNKVIGGGVRNGEFRAYNPLTRIWTVKSMSPSSTGGYTVGTQPFHTLNFDPVDGVFIFIADGSGGRRTWAYRYMTYNDSTPPTVPQNVQAAAASETEIGLSWEASSDPESGVAYYRVYRNGALVATNVAQRSYVDTGLSEGTTYAYEVLAVNGALLESAKSAPVNATTPADATRPTIEGVSASGLATQVKVVFSEPLAPAGAENVVNYAINVPSPILITAASLGADGKTVTLTTGAMSNGVTYTLTVSNVTDRAQAPNVIAPGTQAQFTYVASVLLVDFGPSAGTDTYGLVGWETTIKDTYTQNHAAGPAGMAVSVGGSSGLYNFQGVTSATPRTFVEGEKVVVTWYNNHATSTFTLTPQVSFDDPNRPPSNYPPVGTWRSMTALTLAPGQTGTTEFVFDAVSAGNYSLVNVNANYTFSSAYTMVCDKIELMGAARLAGDINGDGHVDVVDLLFFVDAFGSVTGDSSWDVRCDFNGDGGVDVVDLLMLVENFGR